jgi:hypothetical protein
MRLAQLVPALVLGLVTAAVGGGLTTVYADGADPLLQGRVFQSSDGALWVYRDGLKYPLVGIDLSDGQIDAIPMAGPQIEHVSDLFGPGALSPVLESPSPVAPSSPAPILDVANPQPYDRIPAGLDIQGMAYDPLASAGSGVDRVQVFMEDREKGGVYLGDAALGRLGGNGWQIVVNLPLGPHNLLVYARSAVTGAEAVTSIPVYIVS